jgi:hypothetical protein
LTLGVISVLALSAIGAAPTQSCGPDPGSGTGGTGGGSSDQWLLPYCENGRLEPGEQCDLLDFGGATCATLHPERPLGRLACLHGCILSAIDCHASLANCGNGRVDPGEACDGKDLGGKTCGNVQPAYPNAVGKLGCTPTCRLDARQCATGAVSDMPTTCGNDILERNEACDGQALSVTRCDEQGWEATAPLRCNERCEMDSTGCMNPDSLQRCGNGVVEPQYGEECEGAALGPSCTERGFWTGQLLCVGCRWGVTLCHGCVATRGGIFCQ